MRKTYQLPQTSVVTLASCGFIAQSMAISTEETATSVTIVEVKPHIYSVWEYDWSEESENK